jgi:hypothetical protein
MGAFYDDKNDFFKSKEGKNFRTTVVGIDGKVAYYGKDDGWKAAMDTELAKIVYPNLGKNEVADGAERAAKYFAKREFGKAVNEAEKLLDGEHKEAEADAKLIIERAKDLAEKRNKRVKDWIEDKRYDLAMNCLESLKSEFKNNEIGNAAYDKIKELKKDRQIKKEIKVFELLQKLVNSEGDGAPLDYAKSLHEFAKQQEGFRAGEVAEKQAKRIENELDD